MATGDLHEAPISDARIEAARAGGATGSPRTIEAQLEEDRDDLQTQLRGMDLGPQGPDWQKTLRGDIKTMLGQYARAMGQPTWTFDTWLANTWDEVGQYLNPLVMTPEGRQTLQEGSSFESSEIGRAPVGVNAQHPRMDEMPSGLVDPFTPNGYAQMFNQTVAFLDRTLPGVGDYWNQVTTGSSGGGGGGGGGGPTAGDIRNMFDIEHLTRMAQKIGRSHLVEDLDNPRALAQAYIDLVVSTGAEEEINFETYIINQIKGTDRWKQIYRNKPEGLEPLQYIQPYANTAQQALGGNRGRGISQVVGEGAALGGSAQAFSARLAKEDTVKNQSNFINGIEQRMASISGVLRG